MGLRLQDYVNGSQKEIMEKLSKIQFEGLRTTTGCMRSTVLLVEMGEYPLNLRRNKTIRKIGKLK